MADRILVLTCTMIMVNALAAVAQEPLVTDRPDFTESASIIERGRVQLESGYTFTRAGDAERHELGEVLARIGLGAKLELRVAPNSHVWVPDLDAEGFQDPGIGIKWLIAERESVAAALIAATSLPIGSDDFGAGELQPELVLALARGPMGINVGWSSEFDGGARRHAGLASMAVGVELGERTGGFVEFFGLVAEGAGGEEAYADAGLTRLLSEDFQLDARVGVGLTGRSEDWFVGFGFARRW